MSAWLRRGAAVVLVLISAAALAALGYQAVHRGGAPWATHNPAQEGRDAVIGQARAFMTRVNTYGPELVQGQTMPGYRQAVGELVTAKFRADFERSVPYAEATVTQAGVSRASQVQAAGVELLDIERGRATVLVAGEMTTTFAAGAGKPGNPGKAGKAGTVNTADPAPQPYRVEVSLVRQGGAWKVDDFVPVEGQR